MGIQPSEAKKLTPKEFWQLWDAKHERLQIERGVHNKPKPPTAEAYQALCEYWDDIDNGRT